MNPRSKILFRLAELIQAIRLSHPIRVGIDGVDCSGKTTLADELASIIRDCGREVIRVSIDRFHNKREYRYKQGELSPKGFYEDTFNNDAIISCVLSPLGPDGDLHFCKGQFDFISNSRKVEDWTKVSPNSIILFDGIFLHRPELIDYWDFTIFVDVDFAETVRRAKVRDQYLFGSAEDVEIRYLNRYVPGQRIYLELVNPLSKANVIMVNENIDNPKLIIKNPKIAN